MSTYDYEGRWTEVFDEVRGSSEWCKGAIWVCHLCERVVLENVGEPLRFGVDSESAYERRAPGMEVAPTLFLQRELLLEEQNAGTTRRNKLVGLGGVLAHEMAHHAVFSWGVEDRFREVAVLSDEARRRTMTLLDASVLAKITKIPIQQITGHWAIANEQARELSLRNAVELSDEIALGTDEKLLDETEDVYESSLKHIAQEWSAAVVGCVMAYRIRFGYKRAVQLVDSVTPEIEGADSPFVEKVLRAACQNPDGEEQVRELANRSLNDCFSNSLIEECTVELKKNGSSWKVLEF